MNDYFTEVPGTSKGNSNWFLHACAREVVLRSWCSSEVALGYSSDVTWNNFLIGFAAGVKSSDVLM